MFKEKAKGFIAGAVVSAMVIGGLGIVFAEDISKTVDVIYRNIKIYVDGAEYVAKDANGEIVEPFIYNGTTYLPVRGIANAFGKDVVWDGATASIFLGKKDQNQPDNWLDRIQYNNYKKANGESLTIINGTITDYSENIYTNGILLYIPNDIATIDDDKDKADILVGYALDSQYKNFKGKIVLPKAIDTTTFKRDYCDKSDTDIFIYGDGKLLYHTIATASMPLVFDIDINGVNQLTIKAKSNYVQIALTDLALYK